MHSVTVDPTLLPDPRLWQEVCSPSAVSTSENLAPTTQASTYGVGRILNCPLKRGCVAVRLRQSLVHMLVTCFASGARIHGT